MGTTKERSHSAARTRLPRRSGSSTMGRLGAVRLRDGPKQGIMSNRAPADLRMRINSVAIRSCLRGPGTNPSIGTTNNSGSRKPDGPWPGGAALPNPRHATAPAQALRPNQRAENCDTSRTIRVQRQQKQGLPLALLHQTVRTTLAPQFRRSLSVESYGRTSKHLQQLDAGDTGSNIGDRSHNPAIYSTHPTPQRPAVSLGRNVHHAAAGAGTTNHARSGQVTTTTLGDAEYSGVLNERDSSDEDICMVPADESITPRKRIHSSAQRMHFGGLHGSKGTDMTALNCERLPFAEHYADLGEANFASLIVDCRGEKRELVMLRGSFKLSELTRFEPWVLAKTKFSKLLGGSTGQQAGKLHKLHQRLLQSTDAIEAPWYADFFRVNRADGSWFKAVLVFVPITLGENESGSEILCLLLNADEPGNQTERDACVDLLQNGRSESILLAAAQFLNQRKAQLALALNFEPRVPLVVL